jgi:hypothetical protein
MRLKHIQIKNFRSIRDVTIKFDPTCRILVGINESGKSNILRALAMLDPDIEPEPGNLRDFSPDEDPNQEAFVRFVFLFDKSERTASCERVLSKVAVGQEVVPVAKHRGSLVTLAEVFDSRNEGLYVVNLRDRQKRCSAWSFEKEFALAPGWAKPTQACPPDIMILASDGCERPLHQMTLVHRAGLEVPSDYLTDARMQDLANLVY